MSWSIHEEKLLEMITEIAGEVNELHKKDQMLLEVIKELTASQVQMAANLSLIRRRIEELEDGNYSVN